MDEFSEILNNIGLHLVRFLGWCWSRFVNFWGSSIKDVCISNSTGKNFTSWKGLCSVLIRFVLLVLFKFALYHFNHCGCIGHKLFIYLYLSINLAKFHPPLLAIVCFCLHQAVPPFLPFPDVRKHCCEKLAQCHCDRLHICDLCTSLKTTVLTCYYNYNFLVASWTLTNKELLIYKCWLQPVKQVAVHSVAGASGLAATLIPLHASYFMDNPLSLC